MNLKKLQENTTQDKHIKIFLKIIKKSLFLAHESNTIVLNAHFWPFIMTVRRFLNWFFQKIKSLCNVCPQNFPAHLDGHLFVNLSIVEQ